MAMLPMDSVEILPTSAIGFEGYEKRLEITFFNPLAYKNSKGQGLRALTMASINCILNAARCTIVAKLSNNEFDSYVLSESSLFIYPYKIILKTCGTTELLRSVPVILDFSAKLSLAVLSVKYSRGTFIFPTAQPSIHQNFKNEVAKLNQYFGGLASGGNAYVLGHPASPNQNWHIYYATEKPELPMVTLEMCMTGLNSKKASVFYQKSLDGQSSSAKEMTKLSGISEIIPEMEICDFSFEPCGYSMNGVFGTALSTIHVTPEDAFSYASYEAMGFDPCRWDYSDLIKRVLHCFNPSEFSVAVTVFGGYSNAGSWGERLGVGGYKCKHLVEQELPGGGILIYQSFSATPLNIIFPINVLNAKDDEELAENSGGHEVLFPRRDRNPRRLQDSTAFVYIPSRL